MKQVNYICEDETFPIAETTNDIYEALRAKGYVPCEDLNSKTHEKYIYLDTPNRGPFAHSLATYGGFCRIVISNAGNDFNYYVDFRPSASSETKRFAVDRFVSPAEIARQVGIRNKLIKVVEVSCVDYNFYLKKTSPNGNAMLKLNLQHVKLKEDEKFKAKEFCFLSLKDRTKVRFGARHAENMELEISDCFKLFNKKIDTKVFKQVTSNKYLTLLNIIPELIAEYEKQPF